ncbi:MAG TPA: hypothetical protein H9875_01250, partial [Candidatus Levilactobacillus faecigallinarum]|nr:hypothetical protein [Candidatus Levilactobacillus faecigallinarum]
VFALNTDINKDSHLTLNIANLGDLKLTKHITLTGDNLEARDTFDEPNKVIPQDLNVTNVNSDDITLPKASWNLLIFDVK